ncbi:MAG: hypothetical protein ACLSCV_09110 [Acutalibacteraceae bacterium]
MIAQRLSTVVGADNIFVLQNGHVVEQELAGNWWNRTVCFHKCGMIIKLPLSGK